MENNDALNIPAIKVWIAALRSGNYKQGQQYLKTEDDYCCLGVACDLFSEEDWESDETIEGQDTFLPNSVLNYLGLDQKSRGDTFIVTKTEVEKAYPYFFPSDLIIAKDVLRAEMSPYISLTTLNDEGLSFKGIAFILEGLLEE